MKHLVSGLSITVGGLMFALIGGCQATSPAPLAERDDAVSRYAAYAAAMDTSDEASVTVMPLVQRGEGRVHVLLARRVELPFEVRQRRVRLGAGDALGEQMFERYASFVRAQQRPDNREFVEATEPATDPASEPTAPLAAEQPHHTGDTHRPWLERLVTAISPE